MGTYKLKNKNSKAAFSVKQNKSAPELSWLREAIEKGSLQAQANFVVYLLILTYYFVATTSITHEDLLLQRPISVPFLQVQLPLLWFFTVGPLSIIIIHANQLIQYYYHSQNIVRYDQYIELNSSNKTTERDALSNFFLSNLLFDKDMPLFIKLIIVSTILMFIIISPLAILLLFQGKFLPYHSATITNLHRIYILLDSCLVIISWKYITKTINTYTCKNSSKTITPINFIYKITISVGIISMSTSFLLSAREQDQYYPYKLIPLLAPKNTLAIINKCVNDLFPKDLNLSHKTLLSETIPSNILNSFTQNNHDLDYAYYKTVKTAQIGVDLRNRDLANANFFGAKIPCARFDGANLSNSIFTNAQVHGSSFDGAKMHFTQMQNANLSHVSACGTSFIWSNFNNSNIYDALLAASDFSNSQFYFSKVTNSDLSGSNLSNTDFTGANLTKSLLFGTKLYGTIFINTNLDNSEFIYTKAPLSDFRGSSLFDSIKSKNNFNYIYFGSLCKESVKKIEDLKNALSIQPLAMQIYHRLQTDISRVDIFNEKYTYGNFETKNVYSHNINNLTFDSTLSDIEFSSIRGIVLKRIACDKPYASKAIIENIATDLQLSTIEELFFDELENLSDSFLNTTCPAGASIEQADIDGLHKAVVIYKQAKAKAINKYN